MSSVQHLREFICARLTAAAEEIFSEVEKTIEEEMDRQRRLLEISWSPQIKLPTAVVPHRPVCREDEAVQDEQQLCFQDSDLDQEKAESARIKEEQEELLSCREGEQLSLKDNTDPFSITSASEKNSHSDPEAYRYNIPSCTSPPDDSYLEESMVEDSGPTGRVGKRPENGFQMETNKNEEESFQLESQCSDHTAEKLYFGYSCGKILSNQRQKTVHTEEKQHSCNTCGKRFRTRCELTVHIRSHTGEKPHSCKTCGKCFSVKYNLLIHMRTHTGEKPYFCSTCGKCFSKNYNLLIHMRTHTGEKPYFCNSCGKCFSRHNILVRHMKTHR